MPDWSHQITKAVQCTVATRWFKMINENLKKKEPNQPSPVTKMMVVSASGWDVSSLSAASSVSSSSPSWRGTRKASSLNQLDRNVQRSIELRGQNIQTVGCIWSSSTSTSSSSSSSSSTAASGSSAMSSAESESAETWPAGVRGDKGPRVRLIDGFG